MLAQNVNYIPFSDFKKLCDNTHLIKSDKLSANDISFIFKISYYCALRINETLKLEKTNFDFDLLELDLGHTKTEKHGKATIPKSFVNELKAYLDTKQGGLLFPITRNTAYVHLMQLGKKLNINALITSQKDTNEKTKTHLFRKSIAKEMLYKKAPINIISKKLRHASYNTTFLYLKLNNQDVINWENENYE